MLSDRLVAVDHAPVGSKYSDSFCKRVKDAKPVLKGLLVCILAEEVLLLQQLDPVGYGCIDTKKEHAPEHEQAY